MKLKTHTSWIYSLMGIGVNLVLFILKLLTGLTIQSIAFVNDGFNHLADMATSFVMLFGFWYGERSADDNHPHGHGRAEYVATLVIGLLIIFVSIQLVIQSVQGLMNNDVPTFPWWLYGVLAIAVLSKLGMYVYYINLYKQMRSLPYQAVAWDARNDVFITIFVGLGTYFSTPTWRWDAIAGLAIAGWISVQGMRIMYDAFQLLMGRKSDDAMLEKIGQTILSYPGVTNIHALSYHDYGPLHRVVTVHVELPYTLSLTESHTLIDGLEMILEQRFPIELVIHVDPITDNLQTIHMPKETITTIIHRLFPQVTLTSFRMVNTPNHPEIIFKVNGLNGSQRDIHRQKQLMKQAIQEHPEAYRVFIE